MGGKTWTTKRYGGILGKNLVLCFNYGGHYMIVWLKLYPRKGLILVHVKYTFIF